MSRPGKDKGKGGIRTLSDLNSRGDGSDSDPDNPQEYYTGGEKSGMLVQDPAKGNRDVDAIFERARSVGAQQGPFEVPQAPSSSRNIFSGTAHTLEGNVRDQNPVTQASRQEPVLRTITFWRNGFTVDDGPLRRLDDPANASFLSSISKSECPKELEPADHRSPVHVNLVRRDEDWQPPPEPKHVPFKGIGRALGSSSTADGPTQPARPVNNSVVQGLTVNASEPVTSIQIRLSDGTRMVSKFNHYHTIADIRGFINAARPGSTHDYQLQVMGFPPKILSDPSQTIEQAGLLNAVIIQKS